MVDHLPTIYPAHLASWLGNALRGVVSSKVLCVLIFIWVCLKIGYTPNYSHLVGIMIINHWVFRGTNHFQTNPYCVGWALQAQQSYSNDDGRPQKGKQQPHPQVSSNSVVVHPDPRTVRIDVSRSVRCFKWQLHIPRACGVVFPIHIRYVSVQRHVAGLPWSAMEQITGWEPRLPPRMLAHLFISCSAREKKGVMGPKHPLEKVY